MPDDTKGRGTGSKLTNATIVVCGVAALVASLISFLSIWLQTKNYRKPLLQRYVIRILIMVPIYAASSWTSIMSETAAFYLDTLRDIYEAFTIYTFLQLLINFLGGERSLIIMMHGRPPVHHPWPLNHCFSLVDISDPHTFLAIKRGILQYAWIKPLLGIATVIMRATHTYQEGYIGLTSGYFWSSLIYNVSITVSLYSLAMFWVCMSQDLRPFRPMPKFLCIKLIIFASYWQGFFLSVLQWLGAMPNGVPGYSPDNLAAAMQDALICLEMPIFAISHWYAFSWHDYADVTISAARMPVKYALRDTFGIRDLIEDAKETFGGEQYEYRIFDSGDNVIAHEQSDSRVARMMEGMRYERGGKGKYWIPKPSEVNSRTPLLGPGSASSRASATTYSKLGRAPEDTFNSDTIHEDDFDAEDERLFVSARALEFGDWNYPVITAHVPSAERWFGSDPDLITTSTNRNFLQPTMANKAMRVNKIQKDLGKGKRRTTSSSGTASKSRSRAPVLKELTREESSSSKSAKSGRSQLVDLVIEDHTAEDKERVRARKEGGAAWNQDETKYFVRAYNDDDQGEDIREGFEPPEVRVSLDSDRSESESEDSQSKKEERASGSPHFEGFDDRHIWDSKGN